MAKRILKVIFWLFAVVFIALIAFRVAAWIRETDTAQSLGPDNGRYVETSYGPMHVLTTGVDGPSVLLLHGTAAWGGLWQETAEALAAAGYQAHAMDLPPFGFSARDADGDYTRARQAARVLEVAASMDPKPILVAHSFGAASGVEAVLRRPDAFAGLVIVSGALAVGAHDREPPRLPAPLRPKWVRELAISATATNPLATRVLLAQMMYQRDRATNHYADILRKPLTREGTTAAFADWMPSLLSPHPSAKSTRRDAYRVLQLPTELIWGDQDTVTPLAQGQELADLIPESRLTVLPNVGHIPQLEDPPALRLKLIGALQRISGGAD